MSIEGFEELERTLLELQSEFGDKAIGKVGALGAVRRAAKPLEAAVSAALASVIKGHEERSQQRLTSTVKLTVRKATSKDRRKKNVGKDTIIVAYVRAGINYKDNKGKFRPVGIAFEFGTKKMAKRDFLESTLRKMSPLLVSNMSTEIQKILARYKRKQARLARKAAALK